MPDAAPLLHCHPAICTSAKTAHRIKQECIQECGMFTRQLSLQLVPVLMKLISFACQGSLHIAHMPLELSCSNQDRLDSYAAVIFQTQKCLDRGAI